MVVRNGWGSALVDELLAAELLVFWCTVPFLMGHDACIDDVWDACF